MRLIAWLLLLANVGFFAWYGIYAPPQQHYTMPPLPQAAHLILLKEGGSSDEAAAFVAYEDPLVTANNDDALVIDSSDASMTAVAEVSDLLEDDVTEAPADSEVVAAETAILLTENPTEIAQELPHLDEAVLRAALLPFEDIPDNEQSPNEIMTTLTEEEPGSFMSEDEVSFAAEAEAVPAESALMLSAAMPDTDITEQAAMPEALLVTTEDRVITAATPSNMATVAEQTLPEASLRSFQSLALAHLSSLDQDTPQILPPAASSTPKQTLATDNALACMRVGPYGSMDTAGQVLEAVRAQAQIAQIVASEQAQIDATWVYLPPYPTRADADFVKLMLDRQGLKDHYVVSNNPPGYQHAISLGVYRNDKGAQDRVAELRRHGYHNVRAAPRHKKVSLYWLHLHTNPPQQQRWLAAPEVFRGLTPQPLACKEIAINQ
jgi:hypothetical protein